MKATGVFISARTIIPSGAIARVTADFVFSVK
jgi:hypothetical protein